MNESALVLPIVTHPPFERRRMSYDTVSAVCDQRMVILFAAALPVAVTFGGGPNGGSETVCRYVFENAESKSFVLASCALSECVPTERLESVMNAFTLSFTGARSEERGVGD